MQVDRQIIGFLEEAQKNLKTRRPDITLESVEKVIEFKLSRSAGLHQGRNVGGQRAPDRKRRALHQAEIGARAGPIWHYVALRGTTWHKINPYM